MAEPNARTDLPITHQADVLIAKHAAEAMAAAAGFPERDRAEIGLVVRELGTNLLRHAGGGFMGLIRTTDGIQIEAIDTGPGIPSIEQAVADGYSTGGSLGYGLGTVNRIMDEMTIQSSMREGTTVTARRRVRIREECNTRSPLDIGAATMPKPGFDANGDTFVVKSWANHSLVGVIDGLGHGEPASLAAQAARRYVEGHYDQPMAGIFLGAGTACRGTRGVVMALARFGWKSSTVEFASIGNIETRVLGGGPSLNFVVRRGIVGLSAPPPKVTTHTWGMQGTLVLHSDGVPVHWHGEDFSELADEPAAAVASTILNRLARQTDDATVVVVKAARR